MYSTKHVKVDGAKLKYIDETRDGLEDLNDGCPRRLEESRVRNYDQLDRIMKSMNCLQAILEVSPEMEDILTGYARHRGEARDEVLCCNYIC